MRTTQQKKSTRSKADPRDSFRMTTPKYDVVARPTDPYVNPGGSDNSLSNALNAIKNTVSSFSTLAELKNKEDRQAGADAVAQGQPVEYGGKTQAFFEGAELAKGEREAKIDFRLTVTDYIEKNKHLPADEFLKGYKDIAVNFLNGKSNYYLRGFHQAAQEVEAKALATYQATQRKLALDKYRGDVGGIQQADIDDSLDNFIGVDHKELSENNWKALYNNRKTYFNDETAQYFRDYLTKQQSEHRNVMHRSDMTNMFVEKMINKAVSLGMPELLDFTKVADKKGGYTIASDPMFEQLVAQGYKSAEAVQNARLKASETSRVKQEKERDEAFARQFYAGAMMLTETSPKEDIALYHATYLENAQKFSDGQYTALGKYLSNLLKAEGFPTVSDRETKDKLLSDVVTQRVSYEDFSELLLKNERKLSAADYSEMLKLNEQRKEFLNSPAGKLVKNEWDTLEKHIYNTVLGAGDMDEVSSWRKEQAYGASEGFRRWITNTFLATGEYPSIDDMRKNADFIIKTYNAPTFASAKNDGDKLTRSFKENPVAPSEVVTKLKNGGAKKVARRDANGKLVLE